MKRLLNTFRRPLGYTSLLWLTMLLHSACSSSECIDCTNSASSIIITFCDPAESPIDSLICGEVYEK
ncbi:MAG: hypothetical protein AAGB22_02470 [Bacteroidota bacterium]